MRTMRGGATGTRTLTQTGCAGLHRTHAQSDGRQTTMSFFLFRVRVKRPSSRCCCTRAAAVPIAIKHADSIPHMNGSHCGGPGDAAAVAVMRLPSAGVPTPSGSDGVFAAALHPLAAALSDRAPERGSHPSSQERRRTGTLMSSTIAGTGDVRRFHSGGRDAGRGNGDARAEGDAATVADCCSAMRRWHTQRLPLVGQRVCRSRGTDRCHRRRDRYYAGTVCGRAMRHQGTIAVQQQHRPTDTAACMR